MKNDYEIHGDHTAIVLRRKDGKVFEALIDTEDLSKAKEIPANWYAKITNECRFVVYGNMPSAEGWKVTYLHRHITKAPNNLFVDHINHDTLDNRKSNLRLVTCGENNQNKSGPNKSSTSGIRGVHWHKTQKRWHAYFAVNKKRKHLGSFKEKSKAEEVAFKARVEMMPYSTEARVGTLEKFKQLQGGSN